MKELIIDWIKVICFFVVTTIVLVFLVRLNEEDPHPVNINGKQYIRSKEYSGNGTYQIILVPVDTVNK